MDIEMCKAVEIGQNMHVKCLSRQEQMLQTDWFGAAP